MAPSPDPYHVSIKVVFVWSLFLVFLTVALVSDGIGQKVQATLSELFKGKKRARDVENPASFEPPSTTSTPSGPVRGPSSQASTSTAQASTSQASTSQDGAGVENPSGCSPSIVLEEGEPSTTAPKDNKSYKGTAAKFVSMHRKLYPWLACTSSNTGVQCDKCIQQQNRLHAKTGKANPWYFGTLANFSLKALKRHEESHSNMHNVRMATPSEAGNLHTIYEQVHTAQVTALLNFVNTAFFIGIEGVALLKFPAFIRNYLPSLTPGFDVTDCFQSKSHPAYSDVGAGTQLIQSAAEVLEEDLIQLINKSPFAAWICDESTDITKTSQLLVYVTYLVNDVEVRTDFLKIAELPGGSANDVFNTVRTVVGADNKIPLTKYIHNGCDGCSVLMGSKTGVCTQWRNKVQPFATATHCVCHRNALCVGDAADEIGESAEFEGYISDISNRTRFLK